MGIHLNTTKSIDNHIYRSHNLRCNGIGYVLPQLLDVPMVYSYTYQ
jgi:hypothetical protein